MPPIFFKKFPVKPGKEEKEKVKYRKIILSAEIANGGPKTEMSCLMSNLYHLDRTLNLLSQNIKRKKQNGNEWNDF